MHFLYMPYRFVPSLSPSHFLSVPGRMPRLNQTLTLSMRSTSVGSTWLLVRQFAKLMPLTSFSHTLTTHQVAINYFTSVSSSFLASHCS